MLSKDLLMSEARDLIVREAKSWLDITWRHQGRTRRGIDCAGLVLNVGNDLKLMNYHCNNYPRNTQRDHFISHFKIFGIQVPLKDRNHGDMLLFRDGIYACHCGILEVVDGVEYIIHAYHLRGKTVRERLMKDLLDKMTHCFQYRGLQDG